MPHPLSPRLLLLLLRHGAQQRAVKHRPGAQGIPSRSRLPGSTQRRRQA
jgi:hypothetical protein